MKNDMRGKNVVAVMVSGMEQWLTEGKSYTIVEQCDSLFYVMTDEGYVGGAKRDRFIPDTATTPEGKNIPTFARAHYAKKTKNVRRPKQKPPVRKKTDILITYENGAQYELTNIASVAVIGMDTVFISQPVASGEGFETVKTTKLEGVIHLELVTPNDRIHIQNQEKHWEVKTNKTSVSATKYIWEA